MVYYMLGEEVAFKGEEAWEQVLIEGRANECLVLESRFRFQFWTASVVRNISKMNVHVSCGN